MYHAKMGVIVMATIDYHVGLIDNSVIPRIPVINESKMLHL